MKVRKPLVTIFAVVVLSSCTSTKPQHGAQTTTKIETSPSASETEDANAQFCSLASKCSALYGEGTITLRDGNSSQSGKFELRSKRPTAGGDSLSMVISGPFGITAAKFLGSDKEFHFYNMIENDHYHGKPDAATLEKFTRMKGLSLGLLNDLVYGVSPIQLRAEQLTEAHTEPLGNGKYRFAMMNALGYLEAITYRMTANKLKILAYDRWNRQVPILALSDTKSDLSVKFSGSIEDEPFLVPNLIIATSGTQTLEIEYSQVKENPSNLTVKIKIPQ